ncbi:hypothetical protein [Paludibaculum fermentans]|uniref:hypothetical protein n=1 Tax=Paludibaculum fermentans TaxID=1473598 RepID=UPI003EC0BE5F
MYDVWFATGAAIMSPALLDEVEQAQPVFTFVLREIKETDSNGTVTVFPPAPSTGLLEEDATTRVRLAISGFLRNFSPAAPPVGIYCAGRFCQYFAIQSFSSQDIETSSFRDIIDLANQAYLQALNGGAESQLPAFPAFLGACLMDGAIVANLRTPSAEQLEVAAEFGLAPGSRDWDIALAFTESPEFARAAFFLMAGDTNPWTGGTGEQLFFWPGHSEHAIP